MKKLLIQSLTSQGFSKQTVNAFEEIPRENFLPNNLKEFAYEDNALPIGYEQTISQPYTIATMLELLDLKKGQKALEIGSGSGYVLALINSITNSETYGIEVIKELCEKSKKNLKDYENIKIYNRDGRKGLKEHSLFDRIILSARTEKIPHELIRQLRPNGIIVAPIGDSYEQILTKFKKQKDKLKIKKEIPGFVFVPLVGQ